MMGAASGTGAISMLFASGRIVELILAFMLVEGGLLWLHHRRTGRGVDPVDLLINLLSGISLLLALWAALVGAPWQWIALALAASLAAHLADLRRRWGR